MKNIKWRAGMNIQILIFTSHRCYMPELLPCQNGSVRALQLHTLLTYDDYYLLMSIDKSCFYVMQLAVGNKHRQPFFHTNVKGPFWHVSV